MKSKKNGEYAHVYIMGVMEDCNKKDEERYEIDSKLEEAFKDIIYTTTMELLGEPGCLEKKMKKAVS